MQLKASLTGLASLALLVSGISSQSVDARDVFLTIGGGYSPTGNQISLEKNVQLFSKYLTESYSEPPEHYIFFSDGDNELRDLQYVEPNFPRVNELLARLNNQSNNLKYRYRNHQIDDIFGGSNRTQLEDWFQKQGSGLASGDRLFVYVTAHGGKAGDSKKPENTKLHLWNGQTIDVAKFREWLELIDPEVPVTVVMVQCYSGGFANMIFNDPEVVKENIAVERPICGFFATVHNRVAAGCTADTKEENYHEYTTYLMEALRGETRTGESVERPDFDGDGIVSMDEAHSYALINSITIDISLKTSDQYLRKLEFEIPEEETGFEKDSSYKELLELATLNQRVVLEQLCSQLELEAEQMAEAADDLADRLNREKRDADRERRKITRDLQRSASALKGAVSLRWPELTNAWNPASQQLIQDEGDEIVQAIETHKDFGRFMELSQKVGSLRGEAMDADRKWVKCQRVIRTLESVALAANLAKFGTPEQQETYAKLLSLESGVFGEQGSEDAVATSRP